MKELNIEEIADAYVKAKDAHVEAIKEVSAAQDLTNKLSASVTQLGNTFTVLSKVDANGRVYRVGNRAFLVRSGYNPTEIQLVTIGS